MDQAEPQDQIVPRHQQECGNDQIWVAMRYYLLLTYIKYQTRYGYSLLQLSRIIRETLFDRKSLVDILTVTPEHMSVVRNEALQETLF